MKKLNELQKQMIMKVFPTLGHLVIKYVEKYGNDKDTLQENIDLAYDIMLQHAE
jgi:hypothetical protein